ncbi:hypothetical protein QCA50_013103 [Cerrena zonata]|uniref:Uncharacterized protein n=1 Tax=Cerrena zonata TaxID=2478898 RepID=A0AAW0G2D7_9APHY
MLNKTELNKTLFTFYNIGSEHTNETVIPASNVNGRRAYKNKSNDPIAVTDKLVTAGGESGTKDDDTTLIGQRCQGHDSHSRIDILEPCHK